MEQLLENKEEITICNIMNEFMISNDINNIFKLLEKYNHDIEFETKQHAHTSRIIILNFSKEKVEIDPKEIMLLNYRKFEKYKDDIKTGLKIYRLMCVFYRNNKVYTLRFYDKIYVKIKKLTLENLLNRTTDDFYNNEKNFGEMEIVTTLDDEHNEYLIS